MKIHIFDLRTHREEIVTLEELATYWRVGAEVIRRDILKGALAAYRVGEQGQYRIHITDARAYGRPVDAPQEESILMRAYRYQVERNATTFLISCPVPGCGALHGCSHVPARLKQL